MMNRKIIAFAVASMLAVSVVCASTNNAAAKSTLAGRAPAIAATQIQLPALSLQQIIDRNVAARGGLEAWQRVQSMAFEGKMDAGKVRKDGGAIAMMSSPQGRAAAKAQLRAAMAGKVEPVAEKTIQLPFHMELKRPLMTRLEIPFQGETAIQVYDGTQGWKLRPFLGRHEVETFTPDEQKIAAQQQELDGPLINYAAKGNQVALDGAERVNGHDCYRLKLTLKSGEVRRVWIDAQSFLDIGIEGAPRRWDGKMRPVLTYSHDFRSVNGVMVPYLLETTLEGVGSKEKIVFDKVAVNPMLDDSRFKKPL